MLDLAVVIPTLVGSIFSVLAAGPVFVFYLVLPLPKHFRHTLILNLAAAGKLPTRPFLEIQPFANSSRFSERTQQFHLWHIRSYPSIHPIRCCMFVKRVDCANNGSGKRL